MTTLGESLKWAREAAIETVRWAAALPFPAFQRDYEFVALSHADEYPMNEGRIVSSAGLDIAVDEYDEHFEERHVPPLDGAARGIEGARRVFRRTDGAV